MIKHILTFSNRLIYNLVIQKEKDGNYRVRISKCKDEKDIGMQSLVVRKMI